MTLVTVDDPRRILCESGMEGAAAYVLLARRDVAELVEQPQAVTYIDAAGVQRAHVFDFLVTLRTGTRYAIAIKPAEIAEQRQLRRLLAHIASQMDAAFADGVLMLTEADLPPTMVENARTIHFARRGRCVQHDTRLVAMVANLNGRVQVATLVEALGIAGDGFRAVVRGIADGVLDVVGRGLIDHGTWVEAASDAEVVA